MRSNTVIQHMKSQFARHGIPDILISDNATQYSSEESAQFSKAYGFELTTVSPRHPRANGLAEKTVQIAKHLLIKSKKDGSDPFLALLAYRNTPRDDVLGSPAQRLFSRRTKTQLPIRDDLLQPKIMTGIKEQLQQKRINQKLYYDRQSKELPSLNPGDEIHYKFTDSAKWKPAVVEQHAPTPRSYIIRTPEGKMLRRNRRMIKTTKEPCVFDHDGQAYVPAPQSPIPGNGTEPLSAHNSGSRDSAQNSGNMSPDPAIPVSVIPPTPPARVTASGRTVKMPAKFSDYET